MARSSAARWRGEGLITWYAEGRKGKIREPCSGLGRCRIDCEGEGDIGCRKAPKCFGGQ